jgi:hypothetical protein
MWDLSGATNTNLMFEGATSFNNGGQSHSSWKVHDAINMNKMFQGATAFEGNGLKNWHTANVV